MTVVHTARRSYRFECFGEFFGLDFFPEDQKVVQAITLRGRIRRNKVSVGEPAEGSLLPFIHLARFGGLRNKHTHKIKKRKFSTVDISVLITRKNAANCDKQCELQDPRVIRFLNVINVKGEILLTCLLQC